MIIGASNTIPGHLRVGASAPEPRSSVETTQQAFLVVSLADQEGPTRPSSEEVGLNLAATLVGGPNSLIFLGPPGGGKSTQGKIVAERWGKPHISTGSMLRAEVAKSSELGRRIEPLLEKGLMVSDEDVSAVLESRLAEPDAQAGFILDGFPRTAAQIPLFDEVFPDGLPAVSIHVDEEEIKRRLLARGREDDTEEVIERRLEVYRQQTVPVIEEFESRGLLVTVNGNGTIDETAEAIKNALGR